MNPPLGVVTPRLQHDAGPGPPRLAAVRGVGAQHADPARRAHPEALEDLDRGGLARPVRPQQGEHLAAARRERYAAQYIGPAVPHPQIADIEHIIHTSEDSMCTTFRTSLMV